MTTTARFSCHLIGEGSLLTQCAEALLARGHQILGISSPSRATWDWARVRTIPCATTREDFERSLDHPFDYLFSIINYDMLTSSALAAPRRAAINFHDAPLPRYAGLHATSWAILNGETAHGVSWHRMAARADAGAILASAQLRVEPAETAHSLNLKCYEAALESFGRLLTDLEADAPQPVEQDISARTYYGKYDRPPLVTLWSDTPQAIARLVRATDFGRQDNPFGVARVLLDGATLVAQAAEVLDSRSGATPGTVLAIAAPFFDVAAGGGDVRLRLADSSGVALDEGALACWPHLAVGRVLPTPDPVRVEQLTSATMTLARSEAMWTERLANLAPLAWPLTGRSAAQSPHRVVLAWPGTLASSAAAAAGVEVGDMLAAAVLAFIGRIGAETVFDVALDLGNDHYTDLTSPWVPLRVPALSKASFADYARAVAVSRRDVAATGGFLQDVVARHPRLFAASGPSWRLPLSLGIDTPWPAAPPDSARVELHIDARAAELTIGFGDALLFDVADTIDALDGFVTRLLRAPQTRLDVASAHGARGPWLEAWNNTREAYPAGKRADQLFARQAALTPNAAAVRHQDQVFTYEALERRVRGIAAQLAVEGVAPGAFVGVFLDRSVDLIAGLLGVMRAGAAYVPLDRALPPARITYMLEDGGIKIVLTQSELVAHLPAGRARPVVLDPAHPPSDYLPPDKDNGDDSAYVLYTSGSTGQPKGVLVRHRSLTNLLWAHRRELNLSAGDSTFALATVCFDIFATEALTPLICGGVVEMVSSEDAADGFRLRELVDAKRPTILQATPATWRMLIAAGWTGREDLLMVSTGEALPRMLAEQLLERCPNLWNFYGPTETTVFSSVARVRPGRTITIGRPLANTQLHILDGNLQPLPTGATGELYIGGDGLAAGYLNKPDLTAGAFIVNPIDPLRSARLYRTGDRVRMLPEGEIEYLGRADAQVKVRGYRIELGDVEHALARHPDVAEAVAVVTLTASGEGRLAAYVRARMPNHPPCTSDLRTFLAQLLPSYMVPARLVFLDAFPLTASGKIDKRALPSADLASELKRAQENDPGLDLEGFLTQAWRRELGHADFGPSDNFFDCGGDSVMLITLLAALSRRLGIKLNAVDMLRFPTVATFARHLRSLQDGTTQAAALAPHSATAAPDRFSRLARLRRRSDEARATAAGELVAGLD